MGEERFLKKLRQVAARLFAGRQRGPDAFTPLMALLAARASGDFSVENHEPNCLFGQIVGRVDARRGDELEKRGAVLAKPIGHVLCLARRGNPAGCLGENRFLGSGQAMFDRTLGEFATAMIGVCWCLAIRSSPAVRIPDWIFSALVSRSRNTAADVRERCTRIGMPCKISQVDNVRTTMPGGREHRHAK